MKKILTAAVLIPILVIGILWFRAGKSTPQAAAKTFAAELAKGQTRAAYQRLTTDLTTGRGDYWRDYLKQFASDTPPTFDQEEQIIDRFNTYTNQQDPHRFIYTFHLKSKDYRMVMILIKEGQHWKIDEVHGSAVNK